MSAGSGSEDRDKAISRRGDGPISRLGGDPPSPYEQAFSFSRIAIVGGFVVIGGTTSVDPCGYDAELSDPLYKMIPLLIVCSGPRKAHGIFYDNGAEGCFDLGCEDDNYFGRYRYYEAEDGDLDFYMLLGPQLRDVTPKFVALTGRTALVARLRTDRDGAR